MPKTTWNYCKIFYDQATHHRLQTSCACTDHAARYAPAEDNIQQSVDTHLIASVQKYGAMIDSQSYCVFVQDTHNHVRVLKRSIKVNQQILWAQFHVYARSADGLCIQRVILCPPFEDCAVSIFAADYTSNATKLRNIFWLRLEDYRTVKKRCKQKEKNFITFLLWDLQLRHNITFCLKKVLRCKLQNIQTHLTTQS